MSQPRLRVFIIGGYGFFGGNIVHLLADEPRVTIIVGGSSLARAQAFCGQISIAGQLIPAQVDRDSDITSSIRVHTPDIVVDASGPFQAYGAESGADPYRVVRAAIAAGAHYLDLADASAFVAGIGSLDAEAKARGVCALSGASSAPALTAAVVRRLARELQAVETIEAGIAPTPHADLGLSVMKAIAGYAGKPITHLHEGRSAVGYGLTRTRRWTICPPGRLPLESRRFSLVDVPDLQVLPPFWPGLQGIWFGAGPSPEILHRLLNGMAWLVRWRLLPSLVPLAPLFHRVIGRVRWGEHRGGMLVRVTGRSNEGRPIARTWHLLAEGDDGPLIPSMACAAIIGNMLADKTPAAGARPATGDVELADYERLFAHRKLYSGVREELPDDAQPLYRCVLGDAWRQLPPQISAMHTMGRHSVVRGTARVERGRNLLARLIAGLFRFPKAGADIPVEVRFEAAATPDGRPAERWTRTFAQRRFSSLQSAGRGRSEHLIDERFGPFVFGLAVLVDGEVLRLVPRRWTAFGVPMPRALMPFGDSHERVEDGRFHFHVEIRLPLAGLVVRYQGHLEPVPAPATA